MMIKRVQTEEHEMKVLTASDDNTIFLLRDINCRTRIQSMLKSFEKASSSEINFSKFQAVWAEAYKNRIDKPGQMVWSQLFIKIPEVHFVTQKHLRH